MNIERIHSCNKKTVVYEFSSVFLLKKSLFKYINLYIIDFHNFPPIFGLIFEKRNCRYFAECLGIESILI